MTLSWKPLALAALVLAGSRALAQPPDTSTAGPPAGSDARHGGGGPQTLAEFQARYRERILRADADHDGRVSLAEWTAAHPPRTDDEGGGGRRWGGDPAREFQRLDADHDGYVTAAEIDAASEARFARMDANHDGVLTPEERMAMRHHGADGEGGPAPQ